MGSAYGQKPDIKLTLVEVSSRYIWPMHIADAYCAIHSWNFRDSVMDPRVKDISQNSFTFTGAPKISFFLLKTWQKFTKK